MPRRGENIWKRKDGRWEARYIKGRTVEGRAIYGSVYAKTYKEVKHKREAILSAPQKSSLDDSAITLTTVVHEFLTEKKLKVKISTYTRYVESSEWYIIPFLGNIPISGLSQENIDQFSSHLQLKGKKNGQALSSKTVKDVLAILRQVVTYAKKKKYILSPNFIIEIPKQAKHSIQIFSHKEQNKLEVISISQEDPLKYGIYLSLYTGLRIGELCALRWEDLDLDRAILSVNHTVLRIRDYSEGTGKKTKLIISTPKTDSSLRQIPLPDSINQHLMLIKLNSAAPDIAFFLTGTSKLIEPRNYYEKYKKYLKAADLEGYNFHALRHTFATRCIEKGIDPKALSELLGHSSVQITLDRYVHPTMDTKRDCLEKLIST